MRQIVIDTETTGLSPEEGHRVIEIGCVELIERQLTGNKLHYYLNPQREVEAGALAVHGITNEFLAGKPVFGEIMDEFLNFVQDAELIAHNAPFDVSFLNYEIQLISRKKTLQDIATIFDTLALARKMFPGQRNSLDALCKRFKIDLSGRKLHGALLDANLLAEVYLLMTGGQTNLFAGEEIIHTTHTKQKITAVKRISKQALPIIKAKQIELELHAKMLELLKKKSGKCLWDEFDETN